MESFAQFFSEQKNRENRLTKLTNLFSSELWQKKADVKVPAGGVVSPKGSKIAVYNVNDATVIGTTAVDFPVTFKGSNFYTHLYQSERRSRQAAQTLDDLSYSSGVALIKKAGASVAFAKASDEKLLADIAGYIPGRGGELDSATLAERVSFLKKQIQATGADYVIAVTTL